MDDTGEDGERQEKSQVDAEEASIWLTEFEPSFSLLIHYRHPGLRRNDGSIGFNSLVQTRKTQISITDVVAPEQSNPAGCGQIRAERNGDITVPAA